MEYQICTCSVYKTVFSWNFWATVGCTCRYQVSLCIYPPKWAWLYLPREHPDSPCTSCTSPWNHAPDPCNYTGAPYIRLVFSLFYSVHGADLASKETAILRLPWTHQAGEGPNSGLWRHEYCWSPSVQRLTNSWEDSHSGHLCDSRKSSSRNQKTFLPGLNR